MKEGLCVDTLISSQIQSLQSTIKCQVTSILDDKYIDKIFSGIMSLDDFADYVFFEIATEYYMTHAKKIPLNQHIQNAFEDHQAYLEVLQGSDLLSKKLKSVRDCSDKDFYRRLHDYLIDMLDGRSADLKDAKNIPAFMRDLLAFDSSIANERREGYSLTTAHFLQAYTAYALGIKNAKYLLRLADKNLKADKLEAYYKKQDIFLEFSSNLLYRQSLTDDELDRYIANAIHLKTYEQRYFYNALYTYTSQIANKKRRPTYLCGSIPPIFLGVIGIPWAMGHCIEEGFLSEYYLNQLLVYRGMNERKPHMFLGRYAKAFASYDKEQCHEEECRYYAIQILSANIIYLLRNNSGLESITLQDLAAFIHSRYDVVEEMLRQAGIHETDGFSKNIVSSMRYTVRAIEKDYGFR